MRILVVGSGGREHALCWKLAQSSIAEKVFCAPGNAGIAMNAECVNIPADDLRKLAEFAAENRIDLTVVGPEVPLCAGIVDIFRDHGLAIFGPDRAAARLEGSKSFAKYFMEKYAIPTGAAKIFTSEKDAVGYIKQEGNSKTRGFPGIVVKADGLAAGKGVIVAASENEAITAVNACFSGAFGDAGKKVLIEELLEGEEASVLALTDGKTIIPLASSQDHKRAGNGDTGPNTGGMGAYSPAPVVDGKLQKEIEEKILKNFLFGIQSEGLYYRGIIYAGIMVTSSGPKVLEFNVRFGDPETQAILMRLESDLADAILKTAQGHLDEARLKWTEYPSVCVVMASGGYPGFYKKGFLIKGLESVSNTEDTVVFHAGTVKKDGEIITDGGRVLGVTARGSDICKAAEKAYSAVRQISWEGCIYRKDIAYRAVKRLSL